MNPNIKIVLKAEREVAYTSADNIMPWGTRRDNSKNRRFNEKLYLLYNIQNNWIKILDMGCSGGGFVRDCLNDGCLAVGLEGGDWSKNSKRAEWATIPDYLFTCDVTGDFDLFLKKDGQYERLQFDVVTSWELIEHIAENDLAKLAANVKNHLLPSGLWIMSVSPNEEIIRGIRLHRTVKPKAWWINKFEELGFVHLNEYVDFFRTQFVRGPKYGGSDSFHLVLSYSPNSAPVIPPQRAIDKLYDSWLGSWPQRAIKRWLIGPR